MKEYMGHIVLVTYSINRNDQNGEHLTMHSTRIIFDDPYETWDASDVLNRLILMIKEEYPDILASQIALVNYWSI